MTATVTDDVIEGDMPPEACIAPDFAAEVSSRRPSRWAIARQVRREAECNWFVAIFTVQMVLYRRKPYSHMTLGPIEMLVAHPAFAAIMPDGERAEPGSAHAMLNTWIARDEDQFVHVTTSEGACGCTMIKHRSASA